MSRRSKRSKTVPTVLLKTNQQIRLDEGIIEVIDVDQTMAELLLSLRPSEASVLHQRNVSHAHVTSIARALTLGTFVWLGDPFRLNEDGELIDGQHRCLAVLESGITLKNQLLVTTNTPDAILYIDTTAKLRTPKDLRTITKRPGVMGAVEGAVYLYSSDFKRQSTKGLSPYEKVAITDACGEIPELHDLYNRSCASGVRFTSGILAAALACMHVDKDEALVFFRALANNSPIDAEGNLIPQIPLVISFLLRARNKTGGTTGEAFKLESADKVIMAWNAWREGRALGKLQPSKSDGVATPI